MVYNYLLRIGEVALKGKNKSFFMKTLARNVRLIACKQLKALHASNDCKVSVKLLHNHLLVTSDKPLDFRFVFGITSYSPVLVTDYDLSSIEACVLKALTEKLNAMHYKARNVKPCFRITVKRSDKKFFLTSQELSVKLGSVVKSKHGLKVDLSNPDLEVLVELVQGFAFVSTEKIACFGGLPSGVEGLALVVFNLTSFERDLLTYLWCLKRGCKPLIIAKHLSNETVQFLELFTPWHVNVLLTDFNEETLFQNKDFLKNVQEAEAVFIGLDFEQAFKMQDFLKKHSFKHKVLFPLASFTQDQVSEFLKPFKSLGTFIKT
ncbi:hypothetical protein J7L02_04465 [Candidatus Woesearchaeota archaeon]|nr:hypothetical protein [Candidatus Woesearchaeota archaeon]